MAPPPAQQMAGLRVAVGLGAYVAPDLTAKLFGLDPDANPQGAYLGRLFGARDVALAAGLTATSGPARRLWWQIGIGCDAADFVAAVLGVRSGSISRTTAVLAGATALAAVGLGVTGLQAEDAAV